MSIEPSCSSQPKLAPFLKWAGGKRWLIHKHGTLFPHYYRSYYEPFLGSGAVFFQLAPESGRISDLNKQLIDTYRAVQKDPAGVRNLLLVHHSLHSRDYYYEMRSAQPCDLSGRAARFIYLNRTCWNALYRVNKKGEFNVPIGTKKSVILESDNFEKTSKILSNVEIVHGDFEKTIDYAGKDDFIFIDPPYTVKHNLNGFVKYNEKIFSWDDQLRLFGAIKRAHRRGAKFLMTNANHESLLDLYNRYFKCEIFPRPSIIAGQARHRVGTSELIVSN